MTLVLLPQVSGLGYYSYSPTDRQYGTADAIATIQEIAEGFQLNLPLVQIAIGDISFSKGGSMLPHKSHRDGRHVDIRPLRKDGLHRPCSIKDTQYDADNTKLLVQSFLVHRNVKRVLFNDSAIPKVVHVDGHDNHFHVEMKK